MPTYVYRCRECGHQFEHFEKMTSSGRSRKCPACGARGDRQISGGAGFLFKGDGFYITDYRSEAYRSQHKAESEKAEPAGKAAEGATPGPEAAADKTAAKPDVAKKRRKGAKKKQR